MISARAASWMTACALSFVYALRSRLFTYAISSSNALVSAFVLAFKRASRSVLVASSISVCVVALFRAVFAASSFSCSPSTLLGT